MADDKPPSNDDLYQLIMQVLNAALLLERSVMTISATPELSDNKDLRASVQESRQLLSEAVMKGSELLKLSQS